ncbi:hypothetical protein AHF37_04182 [Paragonimus kellicotti]|nr:hypothetical protein AHF37_04182 [Paragonimus kellicotti]
MGKKTICLRDLVMFSQLVLVPDVDSFGLGTRADLSIG